MDRRHFFARTVALASATAGLAQAQTATASASLSGQTIDGKSYDLRQDRGKVVLVFFWATGCAVCRDKMPELRLNFEAWRDKGFQLLAVSVDKNFDELRAYDTILNRVIPPTQRFPWLWRGAASHRDSFGGITQTPTSLLLDRQGRVVKQFVGRIEPTLWDEMAELVLT
jgi:thiol-disulfide isomerase/thioredoxin